MLFQERPRAHGSLPLKDLGCCRLRALLRFSLPATKLVVDKNMQVASCARVCVHINIWKCVGGCYVKASAAPRMCTLQHERTSAFSPHGDFSELISANSAASPAALGARAYSRGPGGRLVGASARWFKGGDSAVTQCYVAGSGGR